MYPKKGLVSLTRSKLLMLMFVLSQWYHFRLNPHSLTQPRRWQETPGEVWGYDLGAFLPNRLMHSCYSSFPKPWDDDFPSSHTPIRSAWLNTRRDQCDPSFCKSPHQPSLCIKRWYQPWIKYHDNLWQYYVKSPQPPLTSVNGWYRPWLKCHS